MNIQPIDVGIAYLNSFGYPKDYADNIEAGFVFLGLIEWFGKKVDFQEVVVDKSTEKGWKELPFNTLWGKAEKDDIVFATGHYRYGPSTLAVNKDDRGDNIPQYIDEALAFNVRAHYYYGMQISTLVAARLLGEDKWIMPRPFSKGEEPPIKREYGLTPEVCKSIDFEYVLKRRGC